MLTIWSRAGSSGSRVLELLLVAATLVCCSAPSRSNAQGLYYRSIPIGERAIGLGGAYTGISDDPSATYYNPGGLTQGGRFQLLGSLMSIVFTRQTIDKGFDSPNVDSDFTSKGTTTLPHFIGTVVRFGKKKFGDFRYAIAYSSFQIDRNDFGVGISEIETESTVDLRLGNSYTMRWWGVSFGMQATEKVSVGISVFLSSQRGNYSEDIGLSAGGTVDANGLRVGGESVTSSTSLGIDSWSFVFRLGALYRINPRWQIGFMFQPPNAPIKQNGSVFRRYVTDFNDAESSYFLYNEGDFKTKTPIPWELRTGVEYKINALNTLSVDAAVTGPVKDRNVFLKPAELEGLDLELGAYFANTTERRWTPNVAVGAEHLFGKAVVAGGLFTNISSAPDVPETSTDYRPEQISMFGASAAVGLDTKGYRLTVGAVGYFGRGDALTLTLDSEAKATAYRRTKSNVAALVLYIAGAVSVASKGAQDVQGKYKKRKAKKNGEGKEPEEGAEEPAGDTEADAESETDAGPEADAEPETDAEPESEAPSEQSPTNPE